LFGIADAATASGTGSFPTTKSNPLVLDESVRFRSIDAVNPDVTVGQVINHSTGIYRGMCIGVTDAFATAVAGRILFI
jgi:hypothetical protein